MSKKRIKYKIYDYLRYIVIILTLSLLFIEIGVNKAFANSYNLDNTNSSYCKSRKLGWHFYCEENPKSNIKPKNHQPKKATPTAPVLTPEQELKAIQKELDRRKALAILYPTQENIASYIAFQREQLDRSSLFAQQWQKTIWSNPNLDYSLVRPTNTIANRTWIDNRRSKERQALKRLANNNSENPNSINKRYGLFFIYKSTCPYCHSYSPIIKDFAEEYNLTIIPITLDNIKLKQFPTSLSENGQLKKLGITNIRVPATLLYDHNTKTLTPIGYGALTQDELTNRILMLTNNEVQNEL